MITKNKKSKIYVTSRDPTIDIFESFVISNKIRPSLKPQKKLIFFSFSFNFAFQNLQKQSYNHKKKQKKAPFTLSKSSAILQSKAKFRHIQ